MMVFDIYPEVDIDFVYENALDELQNTRVDAEERMMQVVQEADMLLTAILELDMVGEASVAGTTAKAAGVAVGAGAVASKGVQKAASTTGGAIKKAGTKAKELVQRVIQFIKNLFARLVDTMQTWFQNSGKWLEARKGAFEKFKYDDLSIDMVPYWKGTVSNPIQQTSRTLLQAIGDVFKKGGVDKADQTFDGFVERRIKHLKDTDGDLAEGMKNFYRVGNAKGENRVNLAGNNLKSKVTGDFIPTILNYNSYIKEAENVQRTLDNRTSALAVELDKRGITTESALFDLPFEDTLFATFEQFDVLLEAEAGSSSSDRTKVNLGRDVRNDEQKASDAKDKEDGGFVDRMQKESDGGVKVLNNILRAEKLMMSCYLTVMQERYSAYMNALKAIWSAANNEGGRNKDVNGEGNIVGKDEKKK